jgi:hypothetical protein
MIPVIGHLLSGIYAKIECQWHWEVREFPVIPPAEFEAAKGLVRI